MHLAGEYPTYHYMSLSEKVRLFILAEQLVVWIHLQTYFIIHSHAMLPTDYPIIDIKGRELKRTWSVLANPIKIGDDSIKLMHNPNLMGWRVGDRLGISPTEVRATGIGEEFHILAIDIVKGVITLDNTAQYQHDASFVAPQEANQSPALMSAEVVNLSRNILSREMT